jgi:hypothetical protein
LAVYAPSSARSGSLYLALIERSQRIFGMDRETGEWHIHPFGKQHEHQLFTVGPGAKPLLHFLAEVEMLLLEHDLL